MQAEEPEYAPPSTQHTAQSHLTLLHTLRGQEDSEEKEDDAKDEDVTEDEDDVEDENIVDCIAWSPDGRVLASGSGDGTIRLWDGHSAQLLHTLQGHESSVYCVAWAPDGRVLASASEDKTIRLWDGHSAQLLHTLEGHELSVLCVAWAPQGHLLASGSGDETIRLWDGHSAQLLYTLQGHEDSVWCVAWAPQGHLLASASTDKTIRLWDGHTTQPLQTLEGHTADVTCISFSSDGRLLASQSDDDTIRIWRTGPWETVAVLNEECSQKAFFGVAFHPHAPMLATLGERDTIIRMWDVDVAALLSAAPLERAVYYTTAKIALVGESAVGKTGLGYRVAEDRWEVTESTHGQQFWVVDKLGRVRADGTQCEAVLWDFAGQPNFRPIHALFLDDVDLALVLFDPSRPDTLAGVDYWLKQLRHEPSACRTVLVAARTDVSPLSLSSAELEAFCRERNISGGYVVTSAKTAAGIDALQEVIQQQIDWDSKPTTITTQTFKRVKDYVLALKADAERSNVLVSPEPLRSLLKATDPNWYFSDAQMMGSVGHLQNHGYVTVLRRSSEEWSILLAPDLLINLAASYMLRAQGNEKGLGALEEARALRNEYKFPEVEGLSSDERETLLNAVTELFLKRNVCFRESVDGQTFLVFPALILERPPRLVEDAQLVEDLTYVVSGQVENVYAALVVLLGYAPSFQRVYQWRKQAQYETVRGEVCGFKLANDDPGELELVLYYGKDTPEFVRARFQGLFEEILYTRNVRVQKYAPVICPKCGHRQARGTVIEFLNRGETFLFCAKDGRKIRLSQEPERLRLSREKRALLARDQALIKMRTTYETALSSVKRFVHERGVVRAPSCFISYAWGDPAHERWVLKLSDDLRQADIGTVLDQLDNAAISSSIARFVSRIEQCDFILAVGTPSYREKYENMLSPHGSVVAAEVDLMSRRLLGTEAQKASVLPLLLEGEEHMSFPPLLQGRVYANFKREEDYFMTLFDLVLTLHSIPFGDVLVRDLREQLREEAKGFRSKR